MPKYEDIFAEASDLLDSAERQNYFFKRPVQTIIIPIINRMGLKADISDL